MTRWMRHLTYGLGILIVVVAGALAAAIAFDSPSAPPVLAAGNTIPGIAQWNFAELPKAQSVKARDGAPLNYRLYPGRADRAIVLVHGSTGSGTEMLKLAQALQAAGATVYAISLRGHGGSGTRNGDVSYRGQLDDDLADLVKGVGIDKQGIHRTLAGFSSGGGFVLRVAGGPQAGLFDDYLAISPYIGPDSPTSKPDSGGWAGVALPRIVALSLLDGIGLPWFQGLPAIHFATQAKADDRRTPVYSFRLMASLQLGMDWRAVLARIKAPTQIVVGADDELFHADQFQPMMQAINPRIGVTVVPGHGHLGMIADPAAVSAVAAAWRRMADR
ncbi:MAG: alpha/beta hydrolase [Reyranella sp.]|uniref:alpha/beta fold hydrolase n=1 Tax=Reyranella sp. TaxID=1929291 RepID=UPI00121349B6|nr:alpha/beta hydrolase [Reyranella sp.]TAJ38179.1 MAG: alpha/beta hydrolase [Reyranella sp.]